MVVLLVWNDARLISAIWEADSPPAGFVVPAYVTGFISVVLLFLNRNVVLRTTAQILVFSAIYTDLLYLLLGDFPFSYPDAINIFNNPGYASGAINTFLVAFLAAFAGAWIVYALVYLPVKHLRLSFAPAWVVLFLVIQALLYGYSKRYPGIHDYFPMVYRIAGDLLTANKVRPGDYWRRADVTAMPGRRKAEHLFIVVDESVAGTTLSINGFRLPTSPFLEANAGRFINFGVATSFTNYSAGSNLALLSGMLLQELPDQRYVSFAKPSIFQYAKKAGYRTFLLDAQSIGYHLQNYTTSRDLLFVDSFFQPGVTYPDLALYLRDSVIADKIAAIAALEGPTFTYVNKAGAHWPYGTNSPPGLSSRFLKAEYNIPENERAYFRSIRWNVDHFWERLAAKLQHSSNVLIVYTSDHGEDYGSGAIKMKHASIYSTPAIEGMVPLLAFDRAGFFPPHFSPPVNRYAHQYIFPTLLYAMGFDPRFIHTHYGSTLLDPPSPAPRWFQTGDLFGRGKNNIVVSGQ